MGILFAFIALICWGVGDFLIQKTSREFGKWIALFYITFIAAVILTPFIYKDLFSLLTDYPALSILMLTSIIILIAALFEFQAFIDGKISVVEPIMAFEVAVTAVLSFIIIGERLALMQIIFIVLLIFGIFLVSTKSFHHLKQIKAEKGVWLALVGTICMGTTNFLFGIGARETNPLLINWFTSLFLAIVCFIYLITKSKVRQIFKDWRKDKSLIIGVGLIDNAAWVAYSYSTLYIPISIAIAISESYVALAAMLGVIFNGEKLRKHQFFGFVIAVTCAVILAVITPE